MRPSRGDESSLGHYSSTDSRRIVGTAREMVELTRKAVVSGSKKIWDKEEARERRALAGELGRLSGRVSAADADASTAARPPPVKEPEMTTTATTATQNSVPAVPAAWSSPPDAPMDTAETTTELGRELDVSMAERQPKRRRAGRC